MNILRIICLAFFPAVMIGCTKDFLDAKPTKSTIVPTKLADYSAILDNPDVMMLNSTPSLGLLASDDFIAPDNLIKTLPATERGAYLWEKEMPANTSDWLYAYQQVFYCNVVLDGLPRLSQAEQQKAEYNYIYGTAQFLRALAFYNLLEIYAKPYNRLTANTDVGIPIRRSADVNDRPARETVQNGYNQVISDLKSAVALLPATTQFKSRPGRAAAYAMLARVYLVMGDFGGAETAANESLQLHKVLIDYQSLNKSSLRPFPLALPNGNNEILFYGSTLQTVFSLSALTSVSPGLYEQYQAGDLRKHLFFEDKGNGTLNFKGSYSGDAYWFSGLTTAEQYLIRAECYARRGEVQLALADLNALLSKRWDTSFELLKDKNQEQTLALVLSERRKELVGKSLRFSDLRRLNQEPERAITLERTFDGKKYHIEPGDSRYVFLIPDQEIMLTGIPQNMR